METVVTMTVGQGLFEKGYKQSGSFPRKASYSSTSGELTGQWSQAPDPTRLSEHAAGVRRSVRIHPFTTTSSGKILWFLPPRPGGSAAAEGRAFRRSLRNEG